MRKRKSIHPHQPNHERWMVSYADFVTLLFAFFVVMFATANENKGKVRLMGQAVRAALEEGAFANVGLGFREMIKRELKPDTKVESLKPNGTATEGGLDLATQAPKELQASLILLQRELRDEIRRGDVALRLTSRGLEISFRQAALFDSGDNAIKASAYAAIGKVGAAIRQVPNQVRLEGNTDNVPIHNQRFDSNWDLSASRSIAMLNLLVNKFSVPVGRLGVVGYADVAPVASNDTEEGRVRNRRVDVVILSETAAHAEPQGKLQSPSPAK
jgi:chemotaxis protein MotB